MRATPTCAGAPSSPASRSGGCDGTSCLDWCPSKRSTSPTPPHRAVYDELFAQFPAFYKAQRGLFSRTAPRSSLSER